MLLWGFGGLVGFDILLLEWDAPGTQIGVWSTPHYSSTGLYVGMYGLL